jgi:hypothetical protein
VDRHPVNSSMITSIGYDPSTGTLEIEFKGDGAVWQYFDVPESTWSEFEGSESHGKYWHANIKNRFREARIG